MLPEVPRDAGGRVRRDRDDPVSGQARGLADLVSFADRMHFGNASAAKAEYAALLELERVGRAIIWDPEGTISPENVDALNAALAAADESRAE